MAFTKITNTQLNSRGATTLPNQPTISAAALKAEFDAPAKEILAPAFNGLIDELEATTAAADIGIVAPTGRTGDNVKALFDDISSDLSDVEGTSHTHSNKSLLDTYTQTEANLADAVTKKHTHSNKSLLDTYSQTESNLADAVSKKHSHSNKSLLDTYTQTESNLADAVSKRHTHSNKSLLDSYDQTNTNIADAVTKKHSHTNKSVLDKFTEVGGKPAYDGTVIDEGDMKSSDYDPDSSVKTAGGIAAYVEDNAYELPVATSSTLGGVMQGNNISIDEDGYISGNYSNATSLAAGLMSAADKGKLDSLQSDHYISGDTLVFVTTRQVVDGDTLIL